jgi:hypothetical protein
MSESQKETFKTFYANDTDNGALKYQWNHPHTGSQEDFRLTQTPEIQEISYQKFHVFVNLEILP